MKGFLTSESNRWKLPANKQRYFIKNNETNVTTKVTIPDPTFFPIETTAIVR